MKRYTSRFLKAVALCHMGFVLAYLIGIALLFDIPANQLISILLSPSYYLLSLLAAIVGWGLWEMQPWAWPLFLMTSVLTTYSNALMASEYSESHHKVLAFALSLIIQFAMIFRIGREVRVPYFLPKIRWWESNPRYRMSIPAVLKHHDVGIEDGKLLDLSLGGCFIKYQGDIARDEIISLEFKIFGQLIKCTGTVVWKTGSTVTHPQGIGVKFNPFSRAQRRAMRMINHRLRQINSLYRSSRYLMNQEDFERKMQELQSTPISIGKAGQENAN